MSPRPPRPANKNPDGRPSMADRIFLTVIMLVLVVIIVYIMACSGADLALSKSAVNDPKFGVPFSLLAFDEKDVYSMENDEWMEFEYERLVAAECSIKLNECYVVVDRILNPNIEIVRELRRKSAPNQTIGLVHLDTQFLVTSEILRASDRLIALVPFLLKLGDKSYPKMNMLFLGLSDPSLVSFFIHLPTQVQVTVVEPNHVLLGLMAEHMGLESKANNLKFVNQDYIEFLDTVLEKRGQGGQGLEYDFIVVDNCNQGAFLFFSCPDERFLLVENTDKLVSILAEDGYMAIRNKLVGPNINHTRDVTVDLLISGNNFNTEPLNPTEAWDYYSYVTTCSNLFVFNTKVAVCSKKIRGKLNNEMVGQLKNVAKEYFNVSKKAPIDF